MAELTRKQLRIIDYALDGLFSTKSILAPRSVKDFAGNTFLGRLLHLSDNRTILLTDTGLSHFSRIVETIDGADIFEGLTGYSDVWSAFHHILEDLLSRDVRPDNAAELLDIVRERLGGEIANHTYAVPVFGIDMEGIDSIELGSMKIVRSPIPYIESVGIKHGHMDLPRMIEATKNYLWLIGLAEGTRRVSQEKFREQAELAVGMLALSAASMYKNGASQIRIGIVMSPEEGHSAATWLSWSDKSIDLTTHRNYGRSQPFKISSDILAQFAASSIFASAFKVFESHSRTQLEEAIARGVYWYSDAHRDTTVIMRLIKYWSCIETFFSAESKDITRSVSVGLASVLVYGGYGFVPEKEYPALKKRAAKLYNIRSRAVHGAAYRHVSEHDVSDLSQWAAWMLLNMVSFAERGYTKPGQIKVTADRIDEQLTCRRESLADFSRGQH